MISHSSKGKRIPNHIKLYELYNKGTYDENQINLKLKKSGWSDSYISSTKNNLLNYLFKRLRSYYDEETIKRKISNLVFDAEILEKKGFKKSQIKLLLKAKKLSQEYEYFFLATDIIDRLRPMIALEIPVSDSIITLKKFREQRQKMNESIQLENTVKQYYMNCGILYHKKRKGEKFKLELEKLKNQYDSFFLKTNFENFSFNAKLDHFAFNNFYFLLTEVPTSRMKGLNKVIQLYDDNPKFKIEYFDRYLKAVNNYVSHCTRLNDFDSLRSMVEQLDKLKPKLQRQKNKLILNRFYAKVMMHMGNKEFDIVCQIGNQAIRELNLFSEEIRAPKRKMFYINFAQAAYMSKNSKNDLTTWLNHFFNTKPKSEWEAIRIRADFLEIFGLFDEGHFSVAITRCDRLVRQYKKLFNIQPKKETEDRKNQQKLVSQIRDIARIFLEVELSHSKKEKASLKIKANEMIQDVKNSPLVNDWEELRFWLKSNQTNNQNP